MIISFDAQAQANGNLQDGSSQTVDCWEKSERALGETKGNGRIVWPKSITND